MHQETRERFYFIFSNSNSNSNSEGNFFNKTNDTDAAWPPGVTTCMENCVFQRQSAGCGGPVLPQHTAAQCGGNGSDSLV